MKPISRRTVLRGIGTALTLPLLDAMLPKVARAAEFGGAGNGPLRMGFIMIPNGATMSEWTPASEGAAYELPRILKPLASVKDDILVLSGLAQENAAAHGDGGGDHARSAACFLTGAHPRKTSGVDIRAGVSVDQVAARKLGLETRFRSMEIGIDRGGNAGSCDTGYSCAYSSNVSWRSDSMPSSKEVNPRLVFERMFASGNSAVAGESYEKRRRYKQSVLDFVADDAARLRTRLGGTDQQKLDEYLTGVREVETRLQHVESASMREPDGFQKPAGIPSDYKDHLRLMADLMVLAFQGDLTRVSTFMFANEGSNRSYPFLDISEGHHELSHHGGNLEKQEKIAKINRFHMEQFAYLLERLKGVKEGDATLLDNCMIVYGSGISDGNRHNHHNLPIILAGRGGGAFKTGRHVAYPERTPLNNLYLSMLDRVGTPIEHLGDSTGRLNKLTDINV